MDSFDGLFDAPVRVRLTFFEASVLSVAAAELYERAHDREGPGAVALRSAMEKLDWASIGSGVDYVKGEHDGAAASASGA